MILTASEPRSGLIFSIIINVEGVGLRYGPDVLLNESRQALDIKVPKFLVSFRVTLK